VYIEGLVTDFKNDMTKFIEGFLENPSDQSAPRKWKLCELLLVGFMRNKVAPACDAEMAENMGLWHVKCQDSESDVIAVFNEMMLDLKNGLKDPMKFIEIFDELGYKFAETTKQNHTSIFVIDWMVQHPDSPCSLPLLFRKEWKKKVVLQWLDDHNNAETSDDFLERAEKFLQEGVKGEKWGIKILGKVIEINSYVAFFRMEALAALLLGEYCSQQKISNAHQKKQHGAQEAAKKTQCSLPLAISLIVSSSNWHVSFSKDKGPSSACVSEMAWHLQRIACLSAKTLETNEYSFSQLESVKCEPLYNLEKVPAFMPLVASSGARVGPIHAARKDRQELKVEIPAGKVEIPARKVDEPEWLCCPITKEMFRDPVIVPAASTSFEFSTLEKCWKGKEPKEPECIDVLEKNLAMEDEQDHFREQAAAAGKRDRISRILRYIEDGAGNNTHSQHKRHVIVLGLTGSGKSTTINFLAGCKLRRVTEEEADRFELSRDALVVASGGERGGRKEATKIGNRYGKSQTEVLQAVAVDENDDNAVATFFLILIIMSETVFLE
jgi:hypothetical protein